METVFQISNLLVMPFWLLMVFAPTWRWSQRILASPWVLVPIALLYVALLGMSVGSSSLLGMSVGSSSLLAELMNPTLHGIAALLGTPEGAATGWAHLLAFDLFVGRWAYLDSRAKGLNPWLVSPTLLFVFMSGPLGLLLYLALRWLLSRRAA